MMLTTKRNHHLASLPVMVDMMAAAFFQYVMVQFATM